MGKVPLLAIRDLHTAFPDKQRGQVRAVDGISLSINSGEVHGLVGESGCGKSITSLSVLNLVPPPGKILGGDVHWKGESLLDLPPKAMRKIRGKEIAMIFQNPQASLNPLYTVGRQIVSLIRLHRPMKNIEAGKEALRLLRLVQLHDPERIMKVYPHQLSGGMCQRVMIAMALSCKPSLLIADEPTAALDATIQSQIVDLLSDLTQQFNMAMLFISHDMGIVARICDTVSVMYMGKIVERAPVRDLFASPLHPYTKALLDAVPVLDPNVKRKAKQVGDIATQSDSMEGCRFKSRCPYAMEKCTSVCPALHKKSDRQGEVACWLYEQENVSHTIV